ncbi:hypothetical protein EJ04DRAFT_571329 [Polyplosphaeria fusca]|uniref:Uncharacterized protein n=1 Tax=Polyplosphaeria fusca TaxID=682080 RepID=A0A9P4QIY1_9PLEO|nr:hypothetical protein EJ04DRAFT_571329 [Polyplosphaeria fusca]
MDIIDKKPRWPQNWRAPSWSWASLIGQVQYSRDLDPQLFSQHRERQKFPLFDLLDWEMCRKSTSKTCQLLNASLKIKGVLLQTLVDYTNSWFPDRYMDFISTNGPRTRRASFTIDNFSLHGEVRFDNFIFVENGVSDNHEYLCLPILMVHWTPRGSDHRTPAIEYTIEGIMLLATENKDRDEYSRVGHFRISSRENAVLDSTSHASMIWATITEDFVSLPEMELILV